MIDYSQSPIRKPTLREKRQGRGVTARRRASKARRRLQDEQAIKRQVKALDGNRCRWPGCEVPQGWLWGGLEVAHYRAAGMGGDPKLRRCTLENQLALCHWHHRGPRGLHSGLSKIEPLTEAGTRGPVACYERGHFVGETSPPRHA